MWWKRPKERAGIPVKITESTKWDDLGFDKKLSELEKKCNMVYDLVIPLMGSDLEAAEQETHKQVGWNSLNKGLKIKTNESSMGENKGARDDEQRKLQIFNKQLKTKMKEKLMREEKGIPDEERKWKWKNIQKIKSDEESKKWYKLSQELKARMSKVTQKKIADRKHESSNVVYKSAKNNEALLSVPSTDDLKPLKLPKSDKETQFEAAQKSLKYIWKNPSQSHKQAQNLSKIYVYSNSILTTSFRNVKKAAAAARTPESNKFKGSDKTAVASISVSTNTSLNSMKPEDKAVTTKKAYSVVSSTAIIFTKMEDKATMSSDSEGSSKAKSAYVLGSIIASVTSIEKQDEETIKSDPGGFPKTMTGSVLSSTPASIAFIEEQDKEFASSRNAMIGFGDKHKSINSFEAGSSSRLFRSTSLGSLSSIKQKTMSFATGMLMESTTEIVTDILESILPSKSITKALTSTNDNYCQHACATADFTTQSYLCDKDASCPCNCRVIVVSEQALEAIVENYIRSQSSSTTVHGENPNGIVEICKTQPDKSSVNIQPKLSKAKISGYVQNVKPNTSISSDEHEQPSDGTRMNAKGNKTQHKAKKAPKADKKESEQSITNNCCPLFNYRRKRNDQPKKDDSRKLSNIQNDAQDTADQEDVDFPPLTITDSQTQSINRKSTKETNTDFPELLPIHEILSKFKKYSGQSYEIKITPHPLSLSDTNIDNKRISTYINRTRAMTPTSNILCRPVTVNTQYGNYFSQHQAMVKSVIPRGPKFPKIEHQIYMLMNSQIDRQPYLNCNRSASDQASFCCLETQMINSEDEVILVTRYPNPIRCPEINKHCHCAICSDFVTAITSTTELLYERRTLKNNHPDTNQ